MSQKDLLLPWLSVLENVRLGARLRGETSDTTPRALSLLKAAGLATRANDRPDTLSGGMRQRAALARTLMEDRPVVLMDEPFSAVDPLTRLGLQDLAARMLAGRTVIFVTHDPMEALRLGYRVLVLNGNPATPTEIALGLLLGGGFGAVVSEWVGSSAGLGFLMLHANARMQVPLMFAALALLATMAILLHTVIGGILHHRLPWVHDTLDDPR